MGITKNIMWGLLFDPIPDSPTNIIKMYERVNKGELLMRSLK